MSGTFTYAGLQKGLASATTATAFNVSGAKLQSAPISTLLTAFLGADELAITLTQAPVDNGSSITLTGQLQQTIWGLDHPTANAVFTVTGGVAQVVLSITATSWTPGIGFPLLDTTGFDAFAWSECVLILDSSGAVALSADFPAELGWPTYNPLPSFQAGLSLSAKVLPKAEQTILSWAFASGTPIAVSGPIAITVTADGQALPSMLLNGELGQITIGSFSGNFSLQIGSVMQPPNADNQVEVLSEIQVTALVTVKSSIPQPLDFNIVASLGAGTAGPVMIALEPAKDCPLTLQNIGSIISGLLGADVDMTWLGQIPGISALELTAGTLTVALPDLSVAALSFTVALDLDASHPWKPFSDIEIDQLSATFHYFPHIGAGPYITVETSAKIGPVGVSARFSAPDMTFELMLDEADAQAGIAAPVQTGSTAPSTTADLSGTMSGIVGQNTMPAWMSTTKADSLLIVGAITNGSLSSIALSASFQNVWSTTSAGLIFSVNSIVAGLQYAPGQTPSFTGDFITTLTIASVPLRLAVSYDSNGWTFQGGTDGVITLDIIEFVSSVTKDMGLDLPNTGSLPSLTLLNLSATYVTGTSYFDLQALCTTGSQMVGQPLDGTGNIQLGIEVLRQSTDGGTTFTVLFRGILTIGNNVFEVDFSKGTETKLSASWSSTLSAGGLDVRDVLKSLDLDLSFLPDSIDLTLTGAEIVYDITDDVFVLVGDSKTYGDFVFICAKSGTVHQYGFAAEATAQIALSDLPLVGEDLAKIAEVSLTQLQISLVDQGLGTEGPVFNTLLKNMLSSSSPSTLTYPTFPEPGSTDTTRVMFSGLLSYGSGNMPFQLSLVGKSSDAAPAAAPASPAALAPASPAAPASNPENSSQSAQPAGNGAVWINVQKSFGALTIQRIGLRYGSSDQILWFLLDAEFTLGPVLLDLLGMGIGSPLSSFSPSFSLQGMDVGFNSGGIEISGGLTKLTQNGITSYDGQVLIKYQDIVISAMGAYTSLPNNGGASLFIFAVLNKALGGPACFYVTGVAAGFGYNRALTIPAEDNVQSFPLVAGLSDSSKLGGDNPSLDTVLATIDDWIPPQRGEYWMAAGVQFTTFKIINTNALIAVEFGNDLVIAVLGVSTLKQPIEGNTYVYAELDIEVLIMPSLGEIKASAVLSTSSYVLTEDAHLTGGFAFYAWFGSNTHAGDFVFTVGGYHPAFLVPAHYPAEPRLGINWQIDSHLSMTGTAYFAITPAAMMAGAAIAIAFQDGDLKAWLSAGVDIILYWSPFYLIGDAYISVGVSYRLNLLFTHVTLSVEIGANFELWGPPIGGKVHIDWTIISFTISFGDDEKDMNDLPWEDFTKLLPTKTSSPPSAAAPKVGAVAPGTVAVRSLAAASSSSSADATAVPAYLNINPNDGLKLTQVVDANTVWLVRPARFQFSLGCAVPVSAISLKNTGGPAMPTALPVGMRRVNGGISSANYHSTQTVAILKLLKTDTASVMKCMATADGEVFPAGCAAELAELADVEGWLALAMEKELPMAMWGDTPAPGTDPGINTSATLPGTVGLTLMPEEPNFNNGTPIMMIDDVFMDRVINATDENYLPLSQTMVPVANTPQMNKTFADITSINSAAVSSARSNLFGSLQRMGFSECVNNSLPQMQASPGQNFADEPMEGSVAIA